MGVSSCTLDTEAQLRRKGFLRIAGIDEAGRGALAGPVVAAAVIVPEHYRNPQLDDSKKLSVLQRNAVYETLVQNTQITWTFAALESVEVDRLNILRATHEAMRRAVGLIQPPCDFVLIDGLPVHPFPIQQQAIVGGDGKSLSIAAASIIAKVTRDRLMLEFDTVYPHYGFAKHKGYGTAYHLAKLREHGPCPIHRRSFEPVAQRTFNF